MKTPKVSFNYDKDADVMYITFGKPRPCGSDDHYPGIILRWVGNKKKLLNGITIVDYSRRTTGKG